jgi:hypothetical protein
MARTVQVGFRLPADLVARIDAYAARLELGGGDYFSVGEIDLPWTRSRGR